MQRNALDGTFGRALNLAVVFAALATVPVVILEEQGNESLAVLAADWAIWLVFLLEYVIEITFCPNRPAYAKKNWISPLVIIDSPVGDLMLTPEVAFTKSYAPKVGGFYSSQYWDGQGDDVQTHYNNRQDWYLGAKTQP